MTTIWYFVLVVVAFIAVTAAIIALAPYIAIILLIIGLIYYLKHKEPRK
jgi:membrane-bound acyltransferase YfiQ involved in biofilm formation